MEPLMRLETERTLLEPMSLDLMNGVIENNACSLRISGYRIHNEWPENDLKEAIPVFRELLIRNGMNGFNNWTISLKENATIIGSAGFIGNPDKNGMIEIGFGIVPAMRARGFCYEAVRALMKWAISGEAIRGILAHCNDDNIPSKNIIAKLGFTLTKDENGLLEWLYSNFPG